MMEFFKENPIGFLFIVISIITLIGVWIYLVWGVGYHIFLKGGVENWKEHSSRRKFNKNEKKKSQRITEFSIWWTEEKENRYQELLVEEKSNQEERNRQMVEAMFDEGKKSRSTIEYMFDEFQLLKSDRDRHLERLKEENK